MNYKFFCIALAILCLSACSDKSELINNDDDYVSVRFCVKGMNITQEQTRANTIQEAFPMLELVLYTINEDGSYTKYKECSQSNTSSSFCVVSFDNVKCGTYKLVAIGHDDSSHPDMDDPKDIAFSKYVNAYGHTSDIVITRTTSNIDVPFVHKSAKVQFTLNGYIPDEVEKIQFTIEGASNTYNAITGFAASKSTRIAAVNVTESQRAAKKFSTSTYSFLTQEELTSSDSYVNIIITGLNSANEEIDPKTYNNVPMKIGYTTSFTGVFFDYSNISFSLSVNTTWGAYETVNL